MKHLILLIFIVVLTGCSENQNKLSENNSFSKSFVEREIEHLQLLFDFFNEEICAKSDFKDLNKCYANFLKEMEKVAETGNMELEIDFEKQKRIYDRIPDSTFNEIWEYGESYNFRQSPIDTLRTISFNLSGKYLDFLKYAGEKDLKIKNYYDQIRAAGDISPSLVADLIMNHQSYNIEDQKIKFMIAIHYLTLNDQYKRKEKNN